MLSVLLLGVAQQDPKQIKWLDSKDLRKARPLISTEAWAFVHSHAFDLMCRSINIKTETLRELQPSQAMKLFELITSDSKKDSHDRG